MTPAALHADFTEGVKVKVAGRITGLRDMGKSVFFIWAMFWGLSRAMWA